MCWKRWLIFFMWNNIIDIRFVIHVKWNDPYIAMYISTLRSILHYSLLKHFQFINDLFWKWIGAGCEKKKKKQQKTPTHDTTDRCKFYVGLEDFVLKIFYRIHVCLKYIHQPTKQAIFTLRDSLQCGYYF